MSSKRTYLYAPCHHCGRMAPYRKCGGCKLVGYCGPKCQEKNWKWHKYTCSWNQAYEVSCKVIKNKEISGVLKPNKWLDGKKEKKEQKKNVSFAAGSFSPQEMQLAQICSVLKKGETVITGLERLVQERRLSCARKIHLSAKALSVRGLPEVFRMERYFLEQLAAPSYSFDEAIISETVTPENKTAKKNGDLEFLAMQEEDSEDSAAHIHHNNEPMDDWDENISWPGF